MARPAVAGYNAYQKSFSAPVPQSAPDDRRWRANEHVTVTTEQARHIVKIAIISRDEKALAELSAGWSATAIRQRRHRRPAHRWSNCIGAQSCPMC